MKKQDSKNILFILPAILITASVVVAPGINTIYSSFTSWNGFSADKTLIGIDNYLSLFSNKYFWIAIKNNIVWLALFLTIPVLIGMVGALLLLNRRRGRNVLQMTLLVPYVLSPVVNAMIWKNIIYSPSSGIIGFINRLNLGFAFSNPLVSKYFGLIAVAAVDMWHFWSYLMIIYLAALRQVPGEQVEAATVDGATYFQRFRYIYYPNIRSTVRLMFIMIIIFSFLAFDYVQLMTQGGPAHYTELLSTLAYSFAFNERKIGMASAVSMTMSFFGLIASFIYIKLNRGEERES